LWSADHSLRNAALKEQGSSDLIQNMGYKWPVLRPRCIGPGRARTQILFYSILFFYSASLLITDTGVVEMSVLKVPPQMRSTHVGGPFLPTFVAHGIMIQSVLQELGPSVPVLEDTTFCPCVLPERVNACVRLLAGKYRILITCAVI